MLLIKKTLFLLLLLSALIKSSIFLFNTYQIKKHEPEALENRHLAMGGGDSPSYIQPIDNYFAKDIYEYESAPRKFSLNGRAPYYGFFYGFFRLFFSSNTAMDTLVILQLLVAMIGCITFFYLTLNLTSKERVAWIAFLSYSSLSWLANYTNKIVPESLSLSFFVIGLYFFVSYLKTKRKLYFGISSVLFSYMICMRPFLLPPIAAFVLIILFKEERKINLKKKMLLFTYFFLPLSILL